MNRKQRRAAAKLGQPSGSPRGESAATVVATPGADELLMAGLKHQQVGQLADAEACYRRVLAAQPDHADALHLLGVVAHQVGRHDIAVDLIGQAIKRNRQNPIYFSNLGVALKAQNRVDEVVAACRQAIRLKPDYAEAYSNLGDALWAQGKLDEAVAACRQAISLKPDLAEAYCNLGGALKDQGKLDEAVTACPQALHPKPKYAEGLYNRGNALQGLEQFEEALASYDKALALKPEYAEAFNNRGVALQELRRLDKALASYGQALALKPDYAEARWNGSLLRLLTGDFERGWAESEWRWKNASLGLSERNFARPLWRGAESIDGSTMLLHHEQGLGDAIQFCRYVPLVAARGARVILEVEEPLRQLMSGLAGVSHCVSKGEALPDFDLHCPLLSLPLAFGTRLDTIPSTTPYLRAPPHERDWKALLGPKDRFRIGLAWTGNPQHRDDRKRSIE